MINHDALVPELVVYSIANKTQLLLLLLLFIIVKDKNNGKLYYFSPKNKK